MRCLCWGVSLNFVLWFWCSTLVIFSVFVSPLSFVVQLYFVDPIELDTHTFSFSEENLSFHVLFWSLINKFFCLQLRRQQVLWVVIALQMSVFSDRQIIWFYKQMPKWWRTIVHRMYRMSVKRHKQEITQKQPIP